MIPTADGDRLPLDRLLFASPVLEIGKFRVRPGHPQFHDSGPIQRHIVVFPRSVVQITHEGGEPFVAGPDVVTYYNRGQVYRRDSIHEQPDRCEWFAFAPSLLTAAMSEIDPSAADRTLAPFRCPAGPSDPRSYLEQRRLVDALSHGEHPDTLRVEETMVAVLRRLLTAAWGAPFRRDPRSRRSDRDLADAARAELARSFRRPAGLADVAASLGVSVFRLCRVFRRETGSTLHAVRDRLRLASSLERLRQPGRDLTDVALDLGYSSHSHFTAAFRREFGVTPSRFRRGSAENAPVFSHFLRT
ncbi:MAG: AraC family transcriptional regulator [Acidobacteriota bacterium]